MNRNFFRISVLNISLLAFCVATIGPALSMSLSPKFGVSTLGAELILVGGTKVDTDGDGKWDAKYDVPKEPKDKGPKPPREPK